MAKDIFGDDYFSRHRDNNEWDRLKGKNVSKLLNLKNKPKPKLDDVLPPKESMPKEQPKEEEILDRDFKEHIKFTAKWKKDYLKAVISGVCGGLVFYLASFITASESIMTSKFWVDTSTIVLVGLIFVLAFGILYKITEDRM